MSNTDELVIPDVQAEPGLTYEHMTAAGKLAVERKPNLIIQLGDLRDFRSLSRYDSPQVKASENMDVMGDIQAGNEALQALMRPIQEYNRSRNAKYRYHPKLVLLRGNHEVRLDKYLKENPHMKGMFPKSIFAEHRLGFEVVPFLKLYKSPGGVTYCHYFSLSQKGLGTASNNGMPSAHAQVLRLGRSVTAGHRQNLDLHIQPVGDRRNYGLIAGSFYQHKMCYSHPHQSAYWRGIVYKHNVVDGEYDPEFIHIDSLMHRYL